MITNLRISTKPEELDSAWVIGEIRASYWGEWTTPIQLMRAIDHSLCFGAYVDNPVKQVGIARVVTDRATFSSITDMIVGEPWRWQGVGTRLMEAVLAHPWVSPTICVLQSRDAPDFYAKFGFVPVTRNVMKRDPKI